MGTQQGSANSTRLSLDIADLPLTPFGMSPRESRKPHMLPSQRTSKLSLKSLKPFQEDIQASNFRKEKEKVFGFNRYFRQQFSRTSARDTPTNLQTLHEHCSSDCNRDNSDVCSSLQSKNSEVTVNSQEFTSATVTEKVPDHTHFTKQPNRDSIFTDIDDGSFIEFCHGKENGQLVPRLTTDQAKCSPQLYYTCESQNDTQFSTSTKVNDALVGFRKYVEAFKKQIGHQGIIKKSENKMSKLPRNDLHLNFDETIITCSADIQKCQTKVNCEGAFNSTMLDKHPCPIWNPLATVYPNVSTLTALTEDISSSHSGNTTPVKTFKKRSTKNEIQTITISDSSDDDSKIIRTNIKKEKIDELVSRNLKEKDINLKEAKHSENYNISTQRTVLWSQEAYDHHSLISEDVSIVSSSTSERLQPQKSVSCKKTGRVIIDSSGSENEAICLPVNGCGKTQLEYEDGHDVNSVNVFDKYGEFKHTVVTPENAKSPEVAKWIISSPFKDSSFGTSFINRENRYTCITNTPSQPQFLGIDHSSTTSKANIGSEHLKNLEKPKAFCPVNKVMKSPLNMYNSSSSSSESDTGFRRKRGIFCRVVESTSEESDDDRERISKPHRKPNIDTKTMSSKPGCVEESPEISHEDSLHLRLSEGLSKSNKTNEKTNCTIGRDAISPGTLRNTTDSSDDVLGDVRTQKSMRIRRIVDSDSEQTNSDYKEQADSISDLEVSLSDIKIHSNFHVSSAPEPFQKPQTISGKRNFLDLKIIQKELDAVYSSEWRKNEGAVLKSIIKDNENSSKARRQKGKKISENKAYNENVPTGKVKDKVLRAITFESDDEEDSYHEASETSGEERNNCKELENDNEDVTEDISVLTKKKSALVETYCPTYENENEAENDSFEIYLEKVKSQIRKETPNKGTEDKYESDFINDDSDDSYSLPSLTPKSVQCSPQYKADYINCDSISDELKSHKKEKPKKITTSTSISSWRDSPAILISDSDSEANEMFSVTEVKRKPVQRILPFVTPDVKGSSKIMAKTEGNFRQVPRRYAISGNVTPTLSFLASLSTNVPVGRCHPEAVMYIKNFRKHREQLTEKLHRYYNAHVFENKLPPVMSIKWNARMTKTAGFCYYQIDRSKPNGRGARIELSTKVIDAPERLRDTLIHELCHAAAWIISGYKDGHGPLWKAWAAQAVRTFPELPAINRCHSYEISCKYTYRCTRCLHSIGRHSKSLDTQKKVCGYCRGKFELVVNSQKGIQSTGNGISISAGATPKTPRTPGAFAIFVKENYGTVKKSGGNLKHAEVMKILSTNFGKMKASSNL
ncbi:uncharacterized protein [Cherax quadricarinatus]